METLHHAQKFAAIMASGEGNIAMKAAGRDAWTADEFTKAVAVYKRVLKEQTPANGKRAAKPKPNITTHVIGPRTVKFSDAPCRVDGVTYKPGWQWSDEYRKEFRAQHRAAPGNRDACGYIQWLARQRFDGDTRAAVKHVNETQGASL